MSAQQRRIRDLVAVAIFVGLLLFLFWPSGDEGESSDDAPDGVSEEGTPMPESTAVSDAEDERELACEPGDAARVLNAWVGAFNSGDLEALAEMLPDDGAQSPTTSTFPSMDRSMLHSFTVHESGTMTVPDDVLTYLQQRQGEQNERWRIDEVELQRLGATNVESIPLDRATVQIQRTADDVPDHVVDGEIIIDCEGGQVLMVDLFTDEPDLALPIPVDDFLSAVGPYGTGEMRDLRMLVSTDFREDGGSLGRWEIHRIEANSMMGTYVETAEVRTPRGSPVLDYVYDGAQWFLDYRDWQEVGDLTGWAVLPLEIMMTRLEPAVTADILEEHRSEIPESGSVTLRGEFDLREELSRVVTRVPVFQSLEGIVEVRVEDGNLVRTTYRLIDHQSGAHASAPEIEWLHIERRESYNTGLFTRPPGFKADEQQFTPPEDLAGEMTLIERLDHTDGMGERFDLDWDGQQIEIVVMPSRGVTREDARGDDWPLTWEVDRIEFGDATIVAGGPDRDVFPTEAIWDTGQYRFKLTIDSESLDDPAQWNADDVRDIAVALLAAEEPLEGSWSTMGPP